MSTHAPASSRPSRIAWIVPSLIEGSGGHRTIFQNIQALIDAGHECHVFVETKGNQPFARGTPEYERVVHQMRGFFGFECPNVHLGWHVKGDFDLVFATAWYTARFVAGLPIRRKAYFVQDFEALFMPMGDGYLIAENSFRLGLTPLTIGRWLTSKLRREFDSYGTFFEFCADGKVYRPLGRPRQRAVCVICQPEKPRRCPVLSVESMGIIKHHHPDVKVYLYGSREKPNTWFEHTNLGLVNVEQCNELYNTCQVGLCISSSNPSRIPFEMMAAGLPVVDIHRENNVYDMPEGGVLLADQRPEAIARAILSLLDDPAKRESMSTFGVQYMKPRTLERGFAQFVAGVELILSDRAAEFREMNRVLDPMYRRSPVRGPAPMPGEATPQDLAAAAELEQAMRRRLEAEHELAFIDGSRSWRAVQALKRTAIYRALAHLRFGEGWDRVNPAEDPLTRLGRIKNSRSYKLIQQSKTTGVYRWYARRRYGPDFAPTPPNQQH